MESNFVSVFKLDGVPILPPLVNEEVRAAVAIYRQKAIEIEKRLQERRSTMAVDCELIDTNSSIVNWGIDDAECDVSDHQIELEATVNVSTIATANVVKDSSNQSEESTITVPSEVLCESSQQKIVTVIETTEKVQTDQSDCSLIYQDQAPRFAGQAQSDAGKQPCWQSPTRTVTPTSEESMGWFPLVRSNTYNLEKPSIDLMNLQRVDHSTPIDRAKLDPSLEDVKDCCKPNVPTVDSKPNTPKPKVAAQKDTPSVKVQPIPFGKFKTDRLNKSPKQPTLDPAKCRTKRKPASRKISHSTAGSGVASDRALDSVAQALTLHERRMMELLKRQEEERLMLEKSFREKTQELVALCGKSLTIEEDVMDNEKSSMMMMPDCNRTKTPDIHVASSVSQLSLCDVSYDSCTDTDDAAYQTCHANGTSEENVNNNEHTLTEDQPLVDGKHLYAMMNSSVHTTTKIQDSNGNDVISLLPQRMIELQQQKAATVINAYTRGYLTRRLLKTDEVQSIKRTIADIICFIISSQTQAKGMKEDNANQATIRRNAGKHIAFCLDRLHDIFVTCTPQERLQMIRRDRCLKSKSTLPKVHKQIV
ncbi:uncharacterized protein LOC128297865 isoform X2 [Anopheles moucheti]|uniref:uncharacterized protein LOC128297865 isoform X2 n=1 Tax=Anopheles moucheti TaxID=186751 RepID=UPI0022F076D1|nr:uncharacterized protein LOC128297865 isoform X2 [Anopheles moucheti]